MLPDTSYPEKAASMADLCARMHAAPDRLAAAVKGLTPAACEAHPLPGKWSVRECVEHIALVSLGWTDMCYEAIEDDYPRPRTADREWKAPLEAEARQSQQAALDVYRRHCANLAAFFGTLPPEDFTRKFKPVSWLTEPFQISECMNWGVVIHCDWHLVTLHRLRTALGTPLAWMIVYTERYQLK